MPGKMVQLILFYNGKAVYFFLLQATDWLEGILKVTSSIQQVALKQYKWQDFE